MTLVRNSLVKKPARSLNINSLTFSDGVSSIVLLITGDSIASATVDVTATDTAFKGDLADLGITATTLDGAQGGAVLAEEISASVAFWDFANEETSALYTSLISGYEGVQAITDCIICLGTNDADKTNGITNNISVADWTTAYEDYMGHLLTTFPTLERIYVRPIGRHITRNDGQEEWQGAREGIENAVANTAKAHLMPDFWDLPIDGADNVHPTEAAMGTLAEREAQRISYIANGSGEKALGPKATSGVVNDTGVALSISHESGSDLTINGDPSPIFRATGGGIFSDTTSVTKTDSSTLQVNCSPLTKPAIITTLYGTMDTLANDGSDNIRDNSSLALPIRYSQVTATDTDVIRSITDLAYEVRPSYAKTYDSGTDISTIDSANGRSFSNLNASNFMTYDSAAFGGVGGLNSTSLSTVLSSDDGFAAQADLFFGIVVDIPATISGNSYLFAMGTSNTIGTYSQFYFNTSGNLLYSANDSFGQINLGGDFRGGRTAFLINFTSNTNFDVYANDGSTIFGSGNPRNTYAFTNDLFFGGGNTNFKYGNFFAKLGAHDSGDDPSLTAIMDDLKTKNNIT